VRGGGRARTGADVAERVPDATAGAAGAGRGGPSHAVALAILNLVAAGLVLFFLNGRLGEWGGDNVRYLLLAESLGAGRGFVDPFLPGMPFHTVYPPVLPALLAPLAAAGAPLLVLNGFVALLALAGLNLAYFYFAPLYGNRTSLLLVLSTACCGAFLDPALSVMSDGPYLFFSVAALLAVRRAFDGRARRAGLLVAAGVLVALAILTRIAGVVLLPAIAAWAVLGALPGLALRQRLERLAVVGLVAIALAGSWPLVVLSQDRVGQRSYLWEFLNLGTARERAAGPGVGKKPPSLALRPLYNAWDLAERLADTPAPRAVERLSPAAGRAVGLAFAALCAAAAALVALGFARGLLRRRALHEFYVLFYALLLLMWIGGGFRLVMPVIPFLLAYAYDGVVAAAAWRARRHGAGNSPDPARLARAGRAALALTIAVNLAVTFFFPQINDRLHGRYARWWHEFLAASCQLATRAGPDDTVISSPDGVLFWLTGVPSVPLPRHRDPAETLQEILDSGADYLVTSPIQEQKYGRSILRTIEAFPERFRSIERRGEVEVFEIVREPGAPPRPAPAVRPLPPRCTALAR
jgi:4-amino-4-deoxy-L-arabinose transferase-like glycosyltransferase